jgi:hypothetical protein
MVFPPAGEAVDFVSGRGMPCEVLTATRPKPMASGALETQT